MLNSPESELLSLFLKGLLCMCVFMRKVCKFQPSIFPETLALGGLMSHITGLWGTQRFLLTLQSCWRSQQVFWENTKLKFFSLLPTRVGLQPQNRPVNSHKTQIAGKVLNDQTRYITPCTSTPRQEL